MTVRSRWAVGSGEAGDTGHVTDEWKAELLAREPVFDHPEYIWDDVSFEHEIAADFEEIGASGARHSRADIKPVVLGRLAGTHPLSLTGGYSIDGAEVVELVPGLAQVRYTLHGQGRVTRRSTLYRFNGSHWQAVFHQGTVVPGAAPTTPDGLKTTRGS